MLTLYRGTQSSERVTLGRWSVVGLAAVGVVMVTGQMLFLFAMRTSNASLIAPFIYATLIFVMMFDFAVLRVVPDVISLAGAGIIITCGSYIAWREYRMRQRES